MEPAEAKRMADLVEYQIGAVVSRPILKKEKGRVVLFAFDRGEGLSEHTVPHDALVQVLEGEAEIAVDGKPHRLSAGEAIIMPGGQPHAVSAISRFKLMLTMIRR